MNVCEDATQYMSIRISGVDVRIRLHHPDTYHYFQDYITVVKELTQSVSVPEAEWREWLNEGGTDNSYGEYTCLTAAISDELLKHNRCIIHAVAFLYKDKAWLISGPSGVGKSTQARYLQSILPGEFHVICGDRPVLEMMDDQTVFVHPSPWNGKENWKGVVGAPLAGIILLDRGDENSFQSVASRQAVYPILTRMIFTIETEETIKRAAEFENRLLSNVPVYQLMSHSVPESTYLLFQQLFSGETRL